MKKVTKFFMVALLAVMCNFGHAQDDKPDYFSPPKQNEDIIGIVQHSFRDMNSGDATSASSVDWPRSRNSNELYLNSLAELK